MEILNPHVSILLPIRQWRSTTLEAVSSLLNQTLAELEIIVIGHDDVDQIVRRLPEDSRIRGIARAAPGIVGALNTGLKSAKAPFIARMDDDDIAYPDRIEQQLCYLAANPQIEICASKIRFIDKTGSTQGIRSGNRRYETWLNDLDTPTAIKAACYAECPMPHPTLLAHRDVWHDLGGYREFDGPEDYDLILRAMLANKLMGKPDSILQDWREHPNRLTYEDDRYRRQAFTQCRARAASAPASGLKLDAGRGVWICGTGKNARDWHDALEGLNVTVHGFVDVKKASAERRKRDKPVIDYEQLPQRRESSLVIAALSEANIQSQLQAYFAKHNWRNGQEYIVGA